MTDNPRSDVQFERMYRATREPLLAYLVRRTSDPAEAADLLSHVYLVAWQRRHVLPAPDEQRLWLFGVARNVLANHRRTVKRDSGLAQKLSAEMRVRQQAQNDDPDVQALRRALDTLGEDDRELLILAGWDGLAPSEIAKVTGVQPGTVRVQLHRARARLRAALEEDAAATRRAAIDA